MLNLRSYDGKIAGLYDLEETLGRGHYAVVKLAKHVFTGEKVAVKVIDKTKLDEVSKTHIFQEVRCMKLVQHPNVVRLYEVIDTQTKLYLILELGDGGDLYDYIMKHEGGLTEEMAKKYFLQILRAISYCHRLHIVHRDLKPENVVFFEKERLVKITDFGFSNKFNPGQKMETSCGSLAYSAPEILLGESYDAPAVDVWSLGVILYMLVCGSAPFQEANDSETLTMIMDCKYSLPDNVSNECKNLILKMLVRSPENRATLEEIANDAWLKNVDKDEREESYYLPLVSRQQISEEDHNLIIQKMENGKIATKDEITEALEKNPYNHITSTYYLLAERTLRLKRQEFISKKRPNLLTIPKPDDETDNSSNNTLKVTTNLQVPRTPGETFQRGRKCSIVQEEEEDERDDLENASQNYRCSKSESKLNVLVQDKLKINDISQGPIQQPHSSNRTTKIFDECRRLRLPGKNRTTSCSSSDASEDENSYEARHKREQQSILIGNDHKPITVIRRDSHDDSSDSQDTCGDNNRLGSNTSSKFYKTYYRTSNVSDNNNNNSNNKTSNKNCRNAKTKRRPKEARLKESQSLNRIAEVQEDVYVLRRMIPVKKLPSLLSTNTDDELLHSGASSRSDLIADSSGSGRSKTMKRINVTLSGFFKHSFQKNGGSHYNKYTPSTTRTLVTYVDSRLSLFRKFQKDFFSTKTKSNAF